MPGSTSTPTDILDSLEATQPAVGSTEVGGYPVQELAAVTSSPDSAGYPSPAGSSPVPSRTVKSELVATDPGTVQLASGRPQLVEFFAFW